MSVGEILIELQNLDLAIVRDKAQLEQMPELKNLAIKRKTYAKVKSEVNKSLPSVKTAISNSRISIYRKSA